MSRRTRTWGLLCVIMLIALATSAAEPQPPPAVPKSADAIPLAGTMPLTMEKDIASAMIDGIDRFLLKEIDRYWERRQTFEDKAEHVVRRRERLAKVLGVVEPRVEFDSPQLLTTVDRPSLVGRGKNYEVHAIRWPSFGQVHGEGLLLLPVGRRAKADVVAIPDSSQTPEQLVGLADGVPAESQFARRLAESGCRVVIPVIINRETDKKRGLTNREFIYRPAFELGRHIIGYEVQKIRSVIDWFEKHPSQGGIGIIGWGDGGMLALYTAALDQRHSHVLVSGYIDDRRGIWKEPIDRNVFGRLDELTDANLIQLAAAGPKQCRIEAAAGPNLTLSGPTGAPGKLATPAPDAVLKEAFVGGSLVSAVSGDTLTKTDKSGDGTGPYGTNDTLRPFYEYLADSKDLSPSLEPPKPSERPVDVKARHARQLDELDRHNQLLLAESAEIRKKFMAGLDTSSLDKHAATVEKYRTTFYEQVIGKFDQALLPANPRTRKVYDAPKWTGYEVVLDVFPEVFAYGLLLLPKDLKEGEKRPVVVTQHGLEGRPQDTIGPDGWKSYKAFSAQLADRGFIVFSPQNPYIFKDRFRTLQRKANPLGKTLFSIIVPQHQQILNWLKTQPNVDEKRIAFYGLSYGGKTAMRVPAIVTDYCLSICSADFNEWIWKNASSKSPYSYVWTGEYEIFEFDLGSTFNYSDMSALIAPRPFMVERGHFDGVAPDEMVAYEYAKVRNLYAARLGIADRTEIEWFVGPHTINGKATFDFLHKHLNWPKPD